MVPHHEKKSAPSKLIKNHDLDSLAKKLEAEHVIKKLEPEHQLEKKHEIKNLKAVSVSKMLEQG